MFQFLLPSSRARLRLARRELPWRHGFFREVPVFSDQVAATGHSYPDWHLSHGLLPRPCVNLPEHDIPHKLIALKPSNLWRVGGRGQDSGQNRFKFRQKGGATDQPASSRDLRFSRNPPTPAAFALKRVLLAMLLQELYGAMLLVFV